MPLLEQEQRAVERFKDLLLKQFGAEIVGIRLFGSKARGDARPDSDIDLLVVTCRDDWQIKEAIGRIATVILLDDNVYLSVKVLGKPSYDRFLSLKSPFLQNISREGISV